MSNAQLANGLIVLFAAVFWIHLLRGISWKASFSSVGIGMGISATGLIVPMVLEVSLEHVYSLQLMNPMMIGILLFGYPLIIAGMVLLVVSILGMPRARGDQ